MIRYLSLAEVLNLHDRIISETGGSHGLRDLGMLQSALGQPKQTFGGHPFVDGNKRVGHADLEAMLMLNGKELEADVDDAEAEILAVAAGTRTREDVEAWVREHLVDLGGPSG